MKWLYDTVRCLAIKEEFNHPWDNITNVNSLFWTKLIRNYFLFANYLWSNLNWNNQINLFQYYFIDTKQILEQSIDLFIELNQQMNFNWIFKLFDFFWKVLKDLKRQTDHIDLIISILFPNIFIRILFDLFSFHFITSNENLHSHFNNWLSYHLKSNRSMKSIVRV